MDQVHVCISAMASTLKDLLLGITKHCICSALPCSSLLVIHITLTHRCHWPNKGRSNWVFGRVSRFLGSVDFFFRLSVQQWIEWCQRCKLKTVYALENSIFMLLKIGTGGALQTVVSEQ